MPTRPSRLRLPNAPIAPPAATSRARPVAGPRTPPSPLARLTGEQLIAQIARYEASSASNAYQLGLCLRELSAEKRYRTELGFDSFEALLSARDLPSRFTAFKLIAVVSTFSEAEVKQLGGTEKSYALLRFAQREQPRGDPRRVLAPNARVLGRAVGAISTREINSGLAPSQPGAAPTAAARKASRRLGTALRRAGIAHRMRTHPHDGACVGAHFEPASAEALAALLTRLAKLEKKLRRQGALT